MNNKHTFDKLASNWDKKHNSIIRIEGENERLLKLLPRYINDNEVYLDLGCGTGKVTFSIAEMGLKNKIVAVDSSLGMIEVLENKMVKLKENSSIETLVCDVTTCEDSLPQTKFNSIFALQVLHHLNNPEKALKYLADKLTVGGLIFQLVPGDLLFADVIGSKRLPHHKDPLGRFSMEELLSINERAGLLPVMAFNDEWSFEFSNKKDLLEFIEKNSMASKMNGYVTTETIEDLYVKENVLRGNHLTVISTKESFVNELKEKKQKSILFMG